MCVTRTMQDSIVVTVLPGIESTLTVSPHDKLVMLDALLNLKMPPISPFLEICTFRCVKVYVGTLHMQY